MNIPLDDIEDLKELTCDISEYIFEKTKECDEKTLNNVITSVISTLMINMFDHPSKAFKLLERLCDIIENMSVIGEEDDG
jgi:hypothetical protein